jgi:small nuclear ribonucleoprotein (snRNP)-like protein
VLTRLLRGRARLRTRLERRGVVLSGGVLATLLWSRAAAAAVPVALVSATVKAAIRFAAGNAATGLVSARSAAWTEGVLRAMFLTKLKIAAAVVVALALAAGGTGLLTPRSLAEPRPAPQAREKLQAERGRDARAERRPDVRGVLKAVDATKRTLTVAVGDGRRESAEDQTFTVAPKAEIGLAVGQSRATAYREGTLANLAPGAVVLLQLADDQKTVECVLADGPFVRATIKAVDPGKNTITVSTMTRPTRREEAPVEEAKTYTLGKHAEVGVDDGRGRTFSLKEVRLADLPIGAFAVLKLTPDLKYVQIIRAEGPTIRGVLKAVDAGKRQIQLTLGAGRRGEADEEQTYAVDPGADVLLDDGKGRRFSLKEGKLADLPAGAVVTLKLTADQQTATVVQAEGPTVYGLLKVVDPAKNTITLTLRRGRGDDPGEEKTYAVPADAHVVVDGKTAKLADLKADDNGPPVVLRLSLDQQAVRSVMIGGGRR